MSHEPGGDGVDLRWLLAAAVVIAGVVALSFASLRTKLELHTKGRLHRVDHFVAFGVISLLLGLGVRGKRGLTLTAIVTILLGLSLEYAETVVFHSRMEWQDVAVDSAAVVLGTALALMAKTRSERTELANGR